MRRIAATVGVLLLVGIVGSAIFLVIGYRTTTIPDPNADFSTNISNVYYRDGKTKIGDFAIQNRESVDYDQISQPMKDAVIAAENRSFFTDPGFSVRGMARAALAIAKGDSVQGGSTITQQYIKIYYLTSDQSVKRKVREVFLAAKIGRTVPKETILKDYLNTIYYGRGAYGVQAAAQAYFGVDAKDLTAPQSAVLASVINNPTYFDPAVDEDNKARLLDRYRYVLDGMAQSGSITPAQATKYEKALPEFPTIRTSERFYGAKGFLLKMTERELVDAGVPETEINGGGLKIVTTFDKKSQEGAVDTAKKVTRQAASAADQPRNDLHAAIASVDVGTGEVRAIYGGPDYIKSSRNWATTPRPTASTFKTFALAVGLTNGYSLYSVFNGNTFVPPGSATTVRNEFDTQYGPVTLLRATADSINTAFVDLVTSVSGGGDDLMTEAQQAGATKGAGWNGDPRNMVLGGAEVSPLDMANAYATYGNEGVRVPAHVIRSATKESDQTVIYTSDVTEKRAVSADVAADITFALQDVVEEGTGSSVATLNRPVAGKTGTKDGGPSGDDIVSAWFVGYTKQVSTAVMFVAGDGGNEGLDQYKRPGDSTFFGGTYPAQTWRDYMGIATDGQKVEDFPQPAYVNRDSAPQQYPTYQQTTQAPQTSDPTRTATSDPTRTSTDEPSQTSDPTQTATSDPTQTATDEPTQTQTSDPTQTATSDPTQTREPTQAPSTTAPKPSRTASQGNGGEGDGGAGPGDGNGNDGGG